MAGLTIAVGVTAGVTSSGAAPPRPAERIIFESDQGGQRDLWVMSTDGSGASRVTDDKAEDVFPVWSPDGSKIAWGRSTGGPFEIWVMNADGSAATQLTHGGGRVSSWAPDGRSLVFARAGDLWVIRSDGTGERQLTSGPALDLGPDWSPDGKEIAFFSDRNGGSAVYAIAPDGTGLRQITADPLNAGAPGWSPDGKRISFSDNFCATCFSESDFFVMRADGTRVTQLTDTDPENEGGHGWSPDGTRVAITFRSWSPNTLRTPISQSSPWTGPA